jgi:hypothetical protein
MSLTVVELDARWSDMPAPPLDHGKVIQVCVRPDIDRRAFPEELELCPKRGAIGDRWERRTWMHLPDGSPDPRVQVAVASSRLMEFLRVLTGCDHHPGDTLIVDLELGVENLPVGTRLAVGSAVIEVSDVDNDACTKFAAHFGSDVFNWIRAEASQAKRLRGLFARVVTGGVVRNGDQVRIVSGIEP